MTTLSENRTRYKLGEVCNLDGSNIDPRNFPEEDFDLYSIPAFDEYREPEAIKGAEIGSAKTNFASGCVLFSKLNPRIPRVWETPCTSSRRPICSTEFLPLKPRDEILNGSYLAYQLQEPHFLNRLRKRISASTGSRERLSPDVVLSSIVELPPLPKQKRIVAVLQEQMAAVERARAAAEARLKAAEALRATLLDRVFSTGEVLDFPQVRLGEVLRLRKDIVHPRDKPSGPSTFVGLEHVESGTGNRLGEVPIEMAELTGRKPRFYEGDIVYGYLRPYLNKVWIAEFDGLCSVDQYVYAVDGEKAETDYVAWYMRSPAYLRKSPIGKTPGWLPRIRIEEVAAVQVPLPPLATQKTILHRLKSEIATALALCASANAELEAIDAMPAALLRKAFSPEVIPNCETTEAYD